jgi:hypothetical protein
MRVSAGFQAACAAQTSLLMDNIVLRNPAQYLASTVSVHWKKRHKQIENKLKIEINILFNLKLKLNEENCLFIFIGFCDSKD